MNKVTPIDKSSTVLTMILAFILLREPITLIKAIAMVLIGGGTYLMVHKKKETASHEVGEGAGSADSADNASSKSNLWIVYAFGAAIFASLTAILGKVGIEGIESNLGTAIRTVVVLILSWLIVFATRRHKTIKGIGRRSWLFLILSGFAMGGSWLCYYRALQTGQASVVVPIDKLSIVFTIAFSYFILKEN